MPHPISTLGAVHTVLSFVPLLAGGAALLRRGRILPGETLGKVYIAGMVLSVFTAFGLSGTGGFNPGHALGLIALAALAVGVAAPRWRRLGAAGETLQTLAMSFSFMLLWVPGLNETLTRLPAAAPLASGPESPVVQRALGALLLCFIAGVTWQWQMLRRARAASHA